MIVSFNGPTSRFGKPRVIWEENLNEEVLFGVGWPVEMFSQQPKGNRTLIILWLVASILLLGLRK